MFSYPVLLCDLGGTNCRFSVVDDETSDPLTLDNVATDAFASFEDAVRAISQSSSLNPASMIVCAAGPLRGRQVQMTNAMWNIDGPELANALGLQQGLLLNDFEALALSLTIVRPEWTRAIGDVAVVPGRPQIVLGPGTGLGTAALLQTGKLVPGFEKTANIAQVLAIETEAGHTDFAATDAVERDLWTALSGVHARITPETILCGNGLARLHAASTAVASGSAYEEPLSGGMAAQITGQALADPHSEAAHTVRLFWKLIARYAGDMALTFFAQGGVTLAGGILPRIEPLLDPAAFRQHFEDKAPMRKLVAAAPVRLLLQADTVHYGMAAIAAMPNRFALDYAARCWR